MKHPRQRYAIFRFYASFCLLFLSKRSGSDVDELAASCPDGQVSPPDVCLVYLGAKDALPDAYADGKALLADACPAYVRVFPVWLRDVGELKE